MTIDLENCQVVSPTGRTIPFQIDARRQHAMLNGLDDIAQTLSHKDAIAAYRDNHAAHYYLGEAYRGKKVFDKAAEGYAEAVRIKPDNVMVRDDGRAVVTAVDPLQTLAAGTPALQEIARVVREKLGAGSKYIETVRGVGYRIGPAPTSTPPDEENEDRDRSA